MGEWLVSFTIRPHYELGRQHRYRQSVGKIRSRQRRNCLLLQRI